MARNGVRAVLLDVDGTLVDSNDAHARAWVAALAAHGHAVTFEDVRPLIGMGGDKLLPRVSGVAEDTADGRKISEDRGRIFQERYLPHLRPFPRARELAERMRDDGLALAVASSAKVDELKALLTIIGVEWLIPKTTSSDDAERSKPDPDIVHAALLKTGCDPAATLMLGDTPYDLEAARKLGIGTIALRCGGWREPNLRGALAIYEDPADLLAHYEQSPLAR